MEEVKMLELLKRIKICIERYSLMIAKELIQLEINNLKGITEKNCRKTTYYYYNWNCNLCNNFNCNINPNR